MNIFKRLIIPTLLIVFSVHSMNVKASNLSWDVDLDGNTDALTDGLLFLRYTFGLRGSELTSGAISTNSALLPNDVENRLEQIMVIADIDGSGNVDALTDGLIFLRYLFSIKDESLITGVVSDVATKSFLGIYQHLVDHNPGIHTGALPRGLIINEAVSSNSTFEDEDGDSSDWFELFNNSQSDIELTGWTITDNIDEPDKWIFPDTNIAAGEYLRIWASNKNKALGGRYKTLINRGDSFRYYIPTSNPPNNWTSLSFDDNAWAEGNSGFGYSDGDDETIIQTGISSVYIRKTFTLNDVELISELLLDIDFDDGFVAYINGREIARYNILGESPSYDSGTITDREAEMYRGGKPIRFTIQDYESIINNGENVLSIQVHNHNTNSSDLSVIPFLSAFYTGTTIDGFSPPEILDFQNPNLHTNFKLSSKGETLIIYDNFGEQVSFLEVEDIAPDNSIGRSLTTGNNVYYQYPTPGTENPNTIFTGIVRSEVEFSHDGGIFNEHSIILGGAESDEVIHYTLDATIPNESSLIYNSPIIIGANTVIRAKIFKTNHIPSRTKSRTYITNSSHTLPIVTLVSDPVNFFDTQQGIYVYGPEGNYNPYELPFWGTNFWNDWEREVHFSFYEPNGDLGVALNAGVKIFGAWSRGNDQRSMSIFARGRYGSKNIHYPIFPELEYDKFEAIILRNSGNDWMKTNIKDIVATSLMDGSGLETQAYRSAIVYLNGQYWGLYNIREKVNEHFLDDKINVSKSQINILERNGEVVEGTKQTYDELIEFVTNNNLNNDSNYDYVSEKIDIDNFISYQVAQIYLDNTDWPGNNIKFWNSPETKWRWILYDTDFAFGRPWEAPPFYDNDTLSHALEANGPDWPNPPWSTLLFRRLMENVEFKNKFINRFANEANTRFQAESVRLHIENIENTISSEIPRHFQHWSSWENRSLYWQNNFMLSTYNEWVNEVNQIKDFTNNRIPYLTNHFLNYFGISGTHNLTIQINNTEAGSVNINSMELNDPSWEGKYFNDIPVLLEAIAKDGYVFSHWNGSSEQSAEIFVTNSTNKTIEAVFISQ
jgi:hypothetical protein